MIELYQLEQLVCIAEKKTISNAAQELLISQPALSRSMQRLEEDFNVQLFDHYKNKVVLNKNGELAVKRAKDILNRVEKMKKDVQDHDLSFKSVTIASCTPAPICDIEPIMKSLYGELSFISLIQDKQELVKALKNKNANLIITPFEVNDSDIICTHYLDEEIYLSVPKNHPLHNKDMISFEDLENETMLLYSNIGFWAELHKRTMPKTKFLVQEDRQAFTEIVKSSSLPSFTSNLSIKREGEIKDKVTIPFSNDEARVSFYLSILKSDKNKYAKLINKIENYYDY